VRRALLWKKERMGTRSIATRRSIEVGQKVWEGGRRRGALQKYKAGGENEKGKSGNKLRAATVEPKVKRNPPDCIRVARSRGADKRGSAGGAWEGGKSKARKLKKSQEPRGGEDNKNFTRHRKKK